MAPNYLNLSSLSTNSIIYLVLTFILVLLHHAQSLSFNYPSFRRNLHTITYNNHSTPTGGKIQLTKSGGTYSVGRAFYNTPVPLWDHRTRELADFTTHFSFEIIKLGRNDAKYYSYGDGFAFFLAPFNSTAPAGSAGGQLGLLSSNDSIKSTFVAVEFDNFPNQWDPKPGDYQSDHVGIDVDNITSVATAIWNDGSFKNATIGNVWITYNSGSRNLSVYLTFDKKPHFRGDSTLSYTIDLRNYLPETVQVGFSAATGLNSQITYINSWDFNSTTLSALAPALTPAPELTPTPELAPALAPAPAPELAPARAPALAPAQTLAPARAPALAPVPEPVVQHTPTPSGLARKIKSKVGVVAMGVLVALIGVCWV